MKKADFTLLVVDDDPNDLLFVQAAFKAADFAAKIHLAKGGAEAIAYLKGEGKYQDRQAYGYPDFMITDLKMPGVDGFDVLEFLRQSPVSAVVRAAVFSGSRDDEDIRRAYWLGASSYHAKPSSFAELCALAKIMHSHWLACEVPATRREGATWETEGRVKLGERFFPPSAGEEPTAAEGDRTDQLLSRSGAGAVGDRANRAGSRSRA